MQWSAKPSKQTALTYPKTATTRQKGLQNNWLPKVTNTELIEPTQGQKRRVFKYMATLVSYCREMLILPSSDFVTISSFNYIFWYYRFQDK